MSGFLNLNFQVHEKKNDHGNLRIDALRMRIEDGLERSGSGSTQRSFALDGLLQLGQHGEDRKHTSWLDGEDTSPIVSAVHALLQDVQRVKLFARSQYEQLWARLLDVVCQLRNCAEDLHRIVNLNGGFEKQRSLLDTYRVDMIALADDIVKLDEFVRHNIAFCAQLALLADTSQCSLQSKSFRQYVVVSEKALLGKLKMDPLIVCLSDGFELLRTAEIDAQAANCAVRRASSSVSGKWVAPKKFKRVTRKFWLLPKNVVKFKVEVLQHLPILIYGDRQKVSEGILQI